MAFTVMPSINLYRGRCDRLFRNQPGEKSASTDDPAEVAAEFVCQGASWLHVVDQDGAETGRPMQLPLVSAIRKAAPGVKIQLSGGIRSPGAVADVMSMGIERIVVGTAAVEQPDFVMELARTHGERVGVALDVRGGVVTIHNRRDDSGWHPEDLAEKLADWGVRWLVVTDVDRDGAMQGPNAELALRAAASSRLPVQLCGGIGTVNDLNRLARLEQYGLAGAIVGTALYSGELRLDEFLRAGWRPVAPPSDIHKVLVVDDEPDILRIAQMSLQRVGGWQVDLASSSSEGLERARDAHPDLVLLDVMMPDMDGPTILARMREQTGTAQIPVIFITAKAQRRDLERYRELGVAGVILKPFNPMTLPQDVRRIIDGNLALAAGAESNR